MFWTVVLEHIVRTYQNDPLLRPGASNLRKQFLFCLWTQYDCLQQILTVFTFVLWGFCYTINDPARDLMTHKLLTSAHRKRMSSLSFAFRALTSPVYLRPWTGKYTLTQKGVKNAFAYDRFECVCSSFGNIIANGSRAHGGSTLSESIIIWAKTPERCGQLRNGYCLWDGRRLQGPFALWRCCLPVHSNVISTPIYTQVVR
jgi:hypothetical protein